MFEKGALARHLWGEARRQEMKKMGILGEESKIAI
jgi:hypothetical protein